MPGLTEINYNRKENSMKKLILTIALSGLILISSTASGQNVLKIGHVNITEILDSLPQKDSAQVVLDKESKEIEKTYEEMKVEYNKLVDDYQNGLSKFSDLVKKTKESEIVDKQKRLQEFEANASATLQRRNLELIQPIYNKIIKAVEKIATENGFTYILDVSKGSVVFTSHDSQNINQLVLRLLKK
jgi:outer membrane protein